MILPDMCKMIKCTQRVHWMSLRAAGGKSAAEADTERFREYILFVLDG